MQLQIVLGVFLLSAVLFTGCARQVTQEGDDLIRMVITQDWREGQTQGEVLVLDLDGSPLKVLTPPITRGGQFEPALKSTIHLWGGVSFVTDFATQNHRVSLGNGSLLTANSNTGGKSILAPSPKGTIFAVADTLRDTISIYNFINGSFISDALMTDRRILDMAFCDDGETLLVANNNVSQGTYFVSRFNINSAGVITNPVQEIQSGQQLNLLDCAPGAKYGAALVADTRQIMAFSITSGGITQANLVSALVNGKPDKTLDTSRPDIPQAIKFSPDGNNLYVRFSTGGNAFRQGWLEKFNFDITSGAVSGVSNWVAVTPHTLESRAKARISIAPDSQSIYIPDTEGNAIKVINTATGNNTEITDNKIVAPVYVSVGKVTCLDLGGDGC